MSEVKPISIKTLENLADPQQQQAYYKRVNVLVRLFVDLDSPKHYIATTSNYFPIVTLTKLREINQPAALVETYIKKINMILADHVANKKGDVLSPITVPIGIVDKLSTLYRGEGFKVEVTGLSPSSYKSKLYFTLNT